jgi:hypothetical protein
MRLCFRNAKSTVDQGRSQGSHHRPLLSTNKDECEYQGVPAWDGAKLVHFTSGTPFFPETQGCPFSDTWHDEARASMSAVPWQQVMGHSVHVPRVQKFLERTGRLEEVVNG